MSNYFNIAVALLYSRMKGLKNKIEFLEPLVCELKKLVEGENFKWMCYNGQRFETVISW